MKRILVVEDVEFNRDLMVQLLEDDLRGADGGGRGKGIERAERDRPDLILMDLSLPAWTAGRRRAASRANPALKHIPIIAVSAHAMMGDEARARECGCDDYISKPMDEDVLFDKLRRFLGAE